LWRCWRRNMADFEPHGGDVGHESGEFNIRGIVLFIIILVISAGMTFIVAHGLMNLFEWAEEKYFDKPPTAAEQQLNQQRGELAGRQGVRPQPDWYQREVDEKALEKTFATPRLQYDDAADLGLFVNSEKELLDSTGRNPDGSIHIPIDRAIDLLSRQGLPSVNGSFTTQPPLGGLEDISEASKRRGQGGGEQVPQQQTKQKKKQQ
jgi:hypothetical protein